jgi:hypothetical protein
LVIIKACFLVFVGVNDVINELLGKCDCRYEEGQACIIENDFITDDDDGEADGFTMIEHCEK